MINTTEMFKIKIIKHKNNLIFVERFPCAGMIFLKQICFLPFITIILVHVIQVTDQSAKSIQVKTDKMV